jgi:N-acetylmuramoyl-L-alanine amidase
MSKLFILDNGHGGLVDGKYITPGKRSPDFGDGVYFEGVGNRDIVRRIANGLHKLGIDHNVLVKESEDISLSERVARANALHKEYGDTILISVHSDAFTNAQANGWSCFTSPGQTKADEYAEIFYDEAEQIFCGRTIRTQKSDGDHDFEANFKMLRETSMPAVLTENFFMTNLQDYRLLMSEGGKNLIAQLHINAIRRINALP